MLVDTGGRLDRLLSELVGLHELGVLLLQLLLQRLGLLDLLLQLALGRLQLLLSPVVLDRAAEKEDILLLSCWRVQFVSYDSGAVGQVLPALVQLLVDSELDQ